MPIWLGEYSRKALLEKVGRFAERVELAKTEKVKEVSP
jgi:hypothetical protein